jgi:hypothetical protein
MPWRTLPALPRIFAAADAASVARDVVRGQYRAGSGMTRYLANPDNATVIEGD